MAIGAAAVGAGIGLLGSQLPVPDQTVEQQTQLDPAVQQAQQLALSQAQAVQQPQAFFPGSTVAPQSQFGFAGQQLALNQLPGIAEITEAQRQNLLQGLNLSAEQDPRVAALADAATAPLIDQFQEQILPGLRSQAISQGAFGGSRQQIGEAIAARELARAVGETRAGVFGNAFQTALGQEANLQALAPSITQQQLVPSGVLQNIGQQQQAQEQQLIDASVQRFGFEQQAPQQAVENLANIVAGLPAGTSTTQTISGVQPNPLVAAAGGAATVQGLFPGGFSGGGGANSGFNLNIPTTDLFSGNF